MSSNTEKEFKLSVEQGITDYVIDHVSEISTKLLKNMKLAASRKGYDEIVDIIQNELEDREN